MDSTASQFGCIDTVDHRVRDGDDRGDQSAVRRGDGVAKYLAFAPVMILFLAAGFWHGTLGLQVVIEDYIPRESVRIILLVLVKLTFTALAVIGIVAVLKVSL